MLKVSNSKSIKIFFYPNTCRQLFYILGYKHFVRFQKRTPLQPEYLKFADIPVLDVTDLYDKSGVRICMYSMYD